MKLRLILFLAEGYPVYPIRINLSLEVDAKLINHK